MVVSSAVGVQGTAHCVLFIYTISTTDTLACSSVFVWVFCIKAKISCCHNLALLYLLK